MQANDLDVQVLSSKAQAAYFEGVERLRREPWAATSLLLSSQRRLRRAMGLPEHWSVRVLPHRAQALRLVADRILDRAVQEGGPQIALRDDCPADWHALFQSLLPFGITMKMVKDARSLSRRAGTWIQGWVHPETGRMLPPSPAGRAPQECTVVWDASLGLASVPLTQEIWQQEWSCCGWVVCSLNGLLGEFAPTIVCSQWETLPKELGGMAIEPAATLAAALSLEEAQATLEGVGFESARRRAAWEERMRQAGGLICDEALERLPGLSAVAFPGRSASYLNGLLRHKGIWASEALSQGSQSVVQKIRSAETSCVRLAASAHTWEQLQKVSDDLFQALKRSEKLAEGLAAWPVVQSSEDDHRFQTRVMQRAYRPLYCGQLKPEYAVGGLRLVKSEFRGMGVEGLLGLLVDEEDGIIVDAAYQAFGPPTWIALAEILCESLIRKSHVEARSLVSQALEESLTGGEWELGAPARRWLNLWLEAVEVCTAQCQDIECPSAQFVTPITLEGMEPGEPYPGWEQMDPQAQHAVIDAVLDADVRPYIAMDAGGISVVGYENQVLRVAYSGSCTSCPSSMGSTLHAIQQTLRAKVYPDLVVIPEFEASAETPS